MPMRCWPSSRYCMTKFSCRARPRTDPYEGGQAGRTEMTRLFAALALFALLPRLAEAQPAPVPAAAGQDTCTDVQVGTAQSYDCINAQLRALAGAEPKP